MLGHLGKKAECLTKTLKNLTLKVINARAGQANLFRNILFSGIEK